MRLWRIWGEYSTQILWTASSLSVSRLLSSPVQSLDFVLYEMRWVALLAVAAASVSLVGADGCFLYDTDLLVGAILNSVL